MPLPSCNWLITVVVLSLLLMACATESPPDTAPSTISSETNTPPTATPANATEPTIATGGLPTVVCDPMPCNENTAPLTANVDWVEPPQVTSDGTFTLVARVHDGHDLKIANPKDGGRMNVNFSGDGETYGSILPVDDTPGWSWKAKPGSWEADVYTYENKILTVKAKIDPSANTHEGFQMCLWAGGKTRDDTYILGCTEVEQP